MFQETNLKLAQDLVACIKFFNQKNWSPASSTNYSVRSTHSDQYIISRSGVDKNLFELSDLILIDSEGKVLPPFSESDVKSSAETEIHTEIYRRYPEINCVVHTHSVLGTVLSYALEKEKRITFEGLEILKGLEGNTTHLLTEILPIVPNSQNMKDITDAVSEYLIPTPKIHGFLIAGHGLYTWGKDISTAKRHIETFEFLFECFQQMRR